VTRRRSAPTRLLNVLAATYPSMRHADAVGAGWLAALACSVGAGVGGVLAASGRATHGFMALSPLYEVVCSRDEKSAVGTVRSLLAHVVHNPRHRTSARAHALALAANAAPWHTTTRQTDQGSLAQ